MASLMTLILLKFYHFSEEILIELICRLIEILKDRIEGQLLFLFNFPSQFVQYLIYIILDVPWLPPSMR